MQRGPTDRSDWGNTSHTVADYRPGTLWNQLEKGLVDCRDLPVSCTLCIT